MLSMTIGGLWTAQEVADHLGVKRASVYRMAAKSPGFPQPKHVGRTPLWEPEEIKAWREGHPARHRRG
jgi:predicted DNA-binding transcriptional regulator AlpA